MLFFMLNYLYLGFLPLIVSKMRPVVGGTILFSLVTCDRKVPVESM